MTREDVADLIGEVIWFGIKAVLFAGLPIFGIVKCTDSEWYKQGQQEQEARNLAAETPHVIRESDGCKVYAFYADGKTHYFTRCGETVTTDRNYSQTCGKGCTRQETETIVTKGNKP